MQDISDADSVEIQVDSTGKLCININGVCALRIGRCKSITMNSIYSSTKIFFDGEFLNESSNQERR